MNVPWYVATRFHFSVLWLSYKERRRTQYSHPMGAQHSLSKTAMLAAEIKTLRACLQESNTAVDWASESSVQVHSAVNCLENADFHRRTAAGFGFARRSAATAQRVCTGRITRKHSSVSFLAEPAADIANRQGRALATRVPTGMTAATNTVYGLYAEEETKDVKRAGGHATSSASSVCSADSTVPRGEDLSADDWLELPRKKPRRVGLGTEATCERVNTNDMMCALPATNNAEEVDDMFAICEILTGCPTNHAAGSCNISNHNSKHEISFEIADILTSGGNCCGSFAPSPLEPHDSLALAQHMSQMTLATCE